MKVRSIARVIRITTVATVNIASICGIEPHLVSAEPCQNGGTQKTAQTREEVEESHDETFHRLGGHVDRKL